MLKKRTDYNIDCFLSINATIQPLLVILQLIVPLTGIMTEDEAATLRIIFTAIPAMLTIPFIYVRNLYALFMIFGIYAFVLLFNNAFFPTSDTFILNGDAIKLPLVSIIIILCIRSINDFEVFKKILVKQMRITALFGILFGILFIKNLSSMDKMYSMSFSYAMLLPILLLYTTSKWHDIITSLLCLLFVVLIGSRGALIISLSFFLIYTLIFRNTAIILKSVIAFVFASLLLLPNLSSFKSSRTLQMIDSGRMMNDSGRLDIYSTIIEKIWERPFLGWGIGADRQLLFEMGMPHSHNIFLELWVDFGIIIGSVILLTLIWKIIQKFLSFNNAENRVFFVIIVFACLLPLMASSSFLINSSFALLIGVLTSNFTDDDVSILYDDCPSIENDFNNLDDN